MTRFLPILLLAAAVANAGPVEAVQVAAVDLDKIGIEEREFQRYLWHPTPVFSAPPPVAAVAGIYAELNDQHPVVAYHVNQLSRKGALMPPVRITPDVWRVDIRHYGWDRDTWEKLAPRNYIFNERITKEVVRNVRPVARTSKSKSKAKGKGAAKFAAKEVKEVVVIDGPASWLPTEPIAFLIEQTNSRAPIVSSPWFMANTCRQLTLTNEKLGYGYYDWFGVKKPADFLKLFRINLQDSIDLERDVLEVVQDSGVSKQSRSIETHDEKLGTVIFTRDTDNATGRGNPINNLKREDYKAKAREWYIPLPNGLPFYALTDDALEELQASAPDFIGGDRSPSNPSQDTRIHVGIACLRCHASDVLKPVDGWARKNYTADRLLLNVPAFFPNETPAQRFATFLTLQRQYLVLNFANKINEQRERYRRAMQEAAGINSAELVRRFVRSYHQYVDDPVTLAKASLELGYPIEDVRKAFYRYSAHPSQGGVGGINNQLGALVKEPEQTLERTQWEELYREAQGIMLAYKEATP